MKRGILEAKVLPGETLGKTPEISRTCSCYCTKTYTGAGCGLAGGRESAHMGSGGRTYRGVRSGWARHPAGVADSGHITLIVSDISSVIRLMDSSD